MNLALRVVQYRTIYNPVQEPKIFFAIFTKGKVLIMVIHTFKRTSNNFFCSFCLDHNNNLSFIYFLFVSMKFSVSWLASQTHYGDGSGEGEAFEFRSKISFMCPLRPLHTGTWAKFWDKRSPVPNLPFPLPPTPSRRPPPGHRNWYLE